MPQTGTGLLVKLFKLFGGLADGHQLLSQGAPASVSGWQRVTASVL